MSDLTTRLLAEIERREGIVREAVGFNRKAIDSVTLAYLGALRTIAQLHTGPHQCHDREGTVTIVRDGCDTLLAVADALEVEA